jgi:hypothetical protein
VVERSAAGGAPEQIEMSTTLDKGKDKPMDARTAVPRGGRGATARDARAPTLRLTQVY